MNKKQRPETLRNGRLKATIWANGSESSSVYYTIDFVRLYKKDDKWFESRRFFAQDLPYLSELIEQAHFGLNQDAGPDEQAA